MLIKGYRRGVHMSFSKMSKLGSYFIEFISPTSWHVRGG